MSPVNRGRDVYLLKGKSLLVGRVRNVERFVTTGLHAAIQFLCPRGMDELFVLKLGVYLICFWNLECISSVLEFE